MATYKLLELLNATGGVIEGTLVDAGMKRNFREEYDIQTEGDRVRLIPRGAKIIPPVTFPQEIELSPTLLAFLGMYSGDGNKTGPIGFAQRNVELLEASCLGLSLLFGDAVPIAVNLLNDSRYYMKAEFAALVTGCGIAQADLPKLPAKGIPAALRDHFRGEFVAEVANLYRLRAIEHFSVTLSPLKGAREAGGESREYIVNVPSSARLLPVLLLIIEHLNESLHHDLPAIEVNGQTILDWSAPPSTVHNVDIDLHDFVTNHDECRWFTNGNERRYQVVEQNANELVLQTNGRFRCKRTACLGPITSYAAGLYLAEGTTDKATFLHFHEPNGNANVALSFNSSESTSLAIFLHSLRECLGFPEQVITSWKVKVGSQYMYEAQVIGECFQAPMVRRGEKGQGKSASVVQAGFFKEWALIEFPDLRAANQKFSHVEYTGAGVPRVQLTCSSTPARLVFSLYRRATGSLLDACYPAKAAEVKLVVA